MAGNKTSREKLNNTLKHILQILKELNLDNWFVAYGTLLGLVRENSCIANDDDIDIIINKKHYDVLKEKLISEGYKMEYGFGIRDRKLILKTKPSETKASVDFYMAIVEENGDFKDHWEDVNWTKCYSEDGKLIEKEWEGLTLFYPNNYEEKLIGRYGKDWKTPKKSKGVFPRKKCL